MNYELQPRRGPEEVQWDAPMLTRPQDRFSQATLWRAHVCRFATALRKRWWIFLLSLAAIGGPVVLFAFTRPPLFQSQAVMWLVGKVVPGEVQYAEDLVSYTSTQAELIKSPMLQQRAFERVRARFPALLAINTNTASARSPFDLSVHTSARGTVLVLQASGPAPAPTEAFLDTLMDEYLAFKKDSRKRTSSGALSSITDQIREVHKQLQQQQNQVTQFQMSNNISYLTECGVSAGSHLSKLRELLSDLQTEHHLLDLLSPAQFRGLAEGSQVGPSDTALPGEKAARALAMSLPASQTPYYQAFQQMQMLKAKRDELTPVLRPAHPKILKLDQEIAGLERLLKMLQDEGEQRALAQMADRKKAVALQIDNLESQSRAWETNAIQASRKLAEYDRMKQELQRTQALYDRLLSLVQTVDLGKSLDQEPLVPMAAASPARPATPRLRIAAAGLFLAFLMGAAAFVALELLDDRFRNVKELSLYLHAEVVGQIPDASQDSSPDARVLLPVEGAFTESFRNLRSSLLFMPGEKPQPKVILVTSAIPKEGKSTVASNLGMALALSGSRVLVVDADFRRGTLHQLFKVPPEPGLLEILNQRLPPAQAIVPTGQSNLYVLPAGRLGDHTSDLFLRCRVDLLLKELAAQFDYVLIDSAPVLATDDAACLGPFTDGVFLVVRASYTSSQLSAEALDRLHRRNLRVLGVICNRAPASTDYYCQYNDVYRASDTTRPSESKRAETAPGDAKTRGLRAKLAPEAGG